MSQHPRVLVIAEAANPDWVSVPLVGWSLAKALREVADIHLVTQVRNREAILAQGLVEGRDFTAIDSEAVARRIYKAAGVLRMGKGRGWTMVTALASLAYPYFERLVWERFGAAIEGGDYDIVHRVTPLTPTAVSPIARKVARAGVPFVLGPLNGGVPWPRAFDAERRREAEWLSYVRGLYRLMPGRRAMYAATRAVIAGSRHTASELPGTVRDRTIWIPENAIDPELFGGPVVPRPAEGPLRAVFIGRLVPYKGADMAIEAARAQLASGAMRLDVLGDGPMRAELEARIAEAGLGEAVTLHGNVPHDRVRDIAGAAHILLFPSIREFGGGVVLEAMALGTVPVIVDYAGPGELVDERTGIKVPVGTRQEIVAALTARLDDILADRTMLDPLSEAGAARALADFTWSAKASQVRKVYDWVLAGAEGPAPDPLSENGSR